MSSAPIELFLLLDKPQHTGRPKNGVLTVHYGVEEITLNVSKMLKTFYWTYFMI
jgi:hypothetical protein